MAVVLWLMGCGAPEGAWEEGVPAASSEVRSLELEPEGDDVFSDRSNVEEEEPSLEPAPSPTVPLDPLRSLAVTDKAIVAGFTLERVLNQLVAQHGTTGLTSLQLYQQLWDTQNPAPGRGWGAHCTDVGPTPESTTAAFNKYPYLCRTAEGAQTGTTSLASTGYVPIGLFNRFDLAPTSGATCGEYRIVFARQGSSFIIFEASLPNPRAELGIEGCRPVVNFWRNLSANPDALKRKAELEGFYFTGLPGFLPVVHYQNFGNNSLRRGQVRTNTFLSSPWMLREFKLSRPCPTTGCTLRFDPVTDKTNPFGPLFTDGSPHPLAKEFQDYFLTQVPALARTNINTFAYSVPDRFNSGQSLADPGSETDYLRHFSLGRTATFRQNIQDKLTSLNSPLTPEQVVARAQALSCAGCHALSTNKDLGGGLIWPSPTALKFTHVSPQLDSTGTRFQISDALTRIFLPRRQQLLETFLNTPALQSTFVSQVVPTSVLAGQTFTATVTMRNSGNTAWRDSTGFRLASTNTTWGLTRVHLTGTEAFVKTQSKAFTFTATAPKVPGTYTFQWRMVQDGGAGFFGATSTAVTLTVK
jgi:hypothetical protein